MSGSNTQTFTLPTVITSAGLQPNSPASIRSDLLNSISSQVPGYTAQLPGTLIEDVLSTEVAGIALMDAMRVEWFNSLTPLGGNDFTVNQIGVQTGVLQGAATNASVEVIFNSSSIGFAIPPSFTVSDGTNSYVIQDGGVIQSSGQSAQLYAICTLPGTPPFPSAGTTLTNVTSLPGTITLTPVTAQAALPPATAETNAAYRARVLQAQQASAQGMPTFVKTLLSQVQNVQSNLVAIQQGVGGWKIICGGGDQYAVAYAIFQGMFDVSRLVGSVLQITGITNANPGVYTTNLNHGYSNGQTASISGVTPSSYNVTNGTVTVISPTTFSMGVNTSGFSGYVSGGVVTPNLRNISVSLYDYPDTYVIPFVNPPQQTVNIAITWNTISTNYVSNNAMTQAAVPLIISYINNIPVGQPINQFDLIAVFQEATASVLATVLLTRLTFVYQINGIAVSPQSGTGVVAGDPESYFYASASSITVTQG